MGKECACCTGDKDARQSMLLFDNPLRRALRRPRRFLSQYASKGDVAADLGCNRGFFSLPLAELVGPTGRVHALDPDATAIAALTSKAGKSNHQNINASVESAAQQRSIQDRSLDFVFANLVLCCMADHDGALREIKRTLKTDGIAYLSIAKDFRSGSNKVSGREWRSILRGFRVRGARTALFERVAVVSLASDRASAA